ncbi:MAG TPA: mycofactocin precursor MftA [Ktedonobacteraceae bacterium]|jgi:mycofactocin precursor|nr:mycofactocin precursor MftA [Ktedonobacteraceae bacterium]
MADSMLPVNETQFSEESVVAEQPTTETAEAANPDTLDIETAPEEDFEEEELIIEDFTIDGICGVY